MIPDGRERPECVTRLFASIVRFPDRHGPIPPGSFPGKVDKICGGHGQGETPGPIPNPVAKARRGDGTALERVWESSTPPLHTLGVPVELTLREPHFLSLNTSRAQAFYRNGFIDWATMHYFVPKRCTESNKIMYHDKATAQQAADQSWRERGTELWVYRCDFCGTWHLTHRDPQSSYMHVPLNQQLKPHSRKKGYKPRRR